MSSYKCKCAPDSLEYSMPLGVNILYKLHHEQKQKGEHHSTSPARRSLNVCSGVSVLFVRNCADTLHQNPKHAQKAKLPTPPPKLEVVDSSRQPPAERIEADGKSNDED